MPTTTAGPFRLPPAEEAAPLEQQLANWNGHRMRLVESRGILWFVKTMDPLERQRDLAAHALGRGIVNVAALEPLGRRAIAQLQELGVASPGASPLNTILTRLAQTYQQGELPQGTLDAAVAAELVFSLWIRRRDADIWNRDVTPFGIPVFFDLSASLGFEPRTREIARFFARDKYGFAGSWRVRERGQEPLDVLALRAADDHANLVDSVDGFVAQARLVQQRLSAHSTDTKRVFRSAGFSPVETDDLVDFVKSTSDTLARDTERMLEVVLQS